MDEKPKNTITDFIEENQRLLSSIAVFTALSLFINQLPGDLLKSDVELRVAVRLLSTCLCLLAIFAYFEVIKNSLSYPQSGLVHLFNTVLGGTFLLFVYIWGKTYYYGVVGVLALSLGLLIILAIFVLLGLLIRTIMRHSPISKYMSVRVRERYVPVYGSVVLMVVAFLLFRHFIH